MVAATSSRWWLVTVALLGKHTQHPSHTKIRSGDAIYHQNDDNLQVGTLGFVMRSQGEMMLDASDYAQENVFVN
jgi:hypothetical protein